MNTCKFWDRVRKIQLIFNTKFLFNFKHKNCGCHEALWYMRSQLKMSILLFLYPLPCCSITMQYLRIRQLTKLKRKLRQVRRRKYWPHWLWWRTFLLTLVKAVFYFFIKKGGKKKKNRKNVIDEALTFRHWELIHLQLMKQNSSHFRVKKKHNVKESFAFFRAKGISVQKLIDYHIQVVMIKCMCLFSLCFLFQIPISSDILIHWLVYSSHTFPSQ